MPLTHVVRGRIEKIDERIIDLLAERVVLCQEALEEDERALGPEEQAEVITRWESAADERGWNPGMMGRMSRWIMDFCRAGGE